MVLMLAGVFVAACTAIMPGEPTLPPAAPTTPAATPPAATPPSEPGPVLPTLPPFEGDVPADIMALLVEESVALAQASVADVSIVRADAVTWRDASLGCPDPDMVYIQVLTPGYWVVLDVAGQIYDWRMAETGTPVLCPEGQGEPPFEGLPN
jgi:hypothetical protein